MRESSQHSEPFLARRILLLVLAACAAASVASPRHLAAQVLAPGVNPQARAGRFSEGTSSLPDNQSFILTLDFQKGIPLDRTGDSATTFNPTTSHPWVNQIVKTPFLHYPYDLTAENPLAAFGESSGGTPLLIGRSYAFGTFSGRGVWVPGSHILDQYRIKVYRRSDFVEGAANVVPVDVLNFSVPESNDPSQWTPFVAAGGELTIEGDGLKTTLQINDQSYQGWQPWGSTECLSRRFPAPSRQRHCHRLLLCGRSIGFLHLFRWPQHRRRPDGHQQHHRFSQ